MSSQLYSQIVCSNARRLYAVRKQTRRGWQTIKQRVRTWGRRTYLRSGSLVFRRASPTPLLLQGTVAAVAFVGGTVCALAQAQLALTSALANANTIGVISGGADGTYIRIAADLANVLDGEDMRILPIIGRGSLQNLRDIMFLRGVDIGSVQMDAREQLEAETLHNHAASKLRYMARLYNEEVHVRASREITDFRQLNGKKVNIDKNG